MKFKMTTDKILVAGVALLLLAITIIIVVSDSVYRHVKDATGMITLNRIILAGILAVFILLGVFLQKLRVDFATKRETKAMQEAEETIVENDRRYQILAEVSPVGIFHTDATGYTTYVNPCWCRITGMSHEDALGNGWLNAVHEDDKLKLRQGWEEATKKQEVSFSEYRFVRPDGNIAWVIGQAIPERNSDNEIIGYVGTTTDITERKKAEQKLDENRIFIETIINASPDIIYIYDIEERKNIYVNEGIRKNLGFNDEDIKAMDNQVLPMLMHPEDFEKYILTTYKQYAVTKDREIITHEFRMQDKEGNWHWLYCKESIFLRKPDGTPKQVFGIISDITDRKNAQEEIIRERDLSDAIINSLPGIFYLYDHNKKFLRWNRNFETVSGYTSAEVSQMHPLDFFDEEEKKIIDTKINNTFLHGEASVQAGFMLKSKRKIPYYFTGIAIEYKDVPCLMGVGIDVSERMEAQEKIRQTSEQLRQLAGHLQTVREEERKRIGREIHDELGQQLTAIKMDVAWIDKKIPEETTLLKSKLKNVIQLLDGSNQSIRRILSELRPGILDDYGLMEAIEWLGQQFTAHTGIPVRFLTNETEIRSSEPVATCIFRVYQEALTNITRHAKATNIVTSLNVHDDTITVRIEDDGKGFDMEAVEAQKSFGVLGMKERVLSLDGQFEIISAPGKGTTIMISLPYTPLISA